MLRFQCVSVALLSLAFAAGCKDDAESTSGGNGVGVPSAEGQAYILSSEPAGAVDVIEARESAEDDADIVVVGRIGGQEPPWVEGLAAFTIVDESLPDCSQIEGDSCPTPWDYCCASGLADARMLVKFVDESGEVVETGAEELLGLTELQTVVVQGTAQRDADGNLTVLASNVFVRPQVDRPMVPAGEHTHSHDHGHSHDAGTGDTEHAHTHDHEHADDDHSHAEGTDEGAHAHDEHEHSHADEDHEHSDEGVEIEHSHDDGDAEHSHDDDEEPTDE